MLSMFYVGGEMHSHWRSPLSSFDTQSSKGGAESGTGTIAVGWWLCNCYSPSNSQQDSKSSNRNSSSDESNNNRTSPKNPITLFSDAITIRHCFSGN